MCGSTFIVLLSNSFAGLTGLYQIRVDQRISNEEKAVPRCIHCRLKIRALNQHGTDIPITSGLDEQMLMKGVQLLLCTLPFWQFIPFRLPLS